MRLVRNDIATALSGETNVYDVIYSGFALHHLPLEGKAKFFHRAPLRSYCHNDLPEPLSVLHGQAGAAGLGKMEQIGSYNWHHFLSFTRN